MLCTSRRRCGTSHVQCSHLWQTARLRRLACNNELQNPLGGHDTELSIPTSSSHFRVKPIRTLGAQLLRLSVRGRKNTTARSVLDCCFQGRSALSIVYTLPINVALPLPASARDCQSSKLSPSRLPCSYQTDRDSGLRCAGRQREMDWSSTADNGSYCFSSHDCQSMSPSHR